jgi:hypothetical protein
MLSILLTPAVVVLFQNGEGLTKVSYNNNKQSVVENR